MKHLLLALFSTLIFFSCSETTETETSKFTYDDFITIEATVVKDTANTAIPTWYNGTYLAKMMEYSGLKGVRHVKKMAAISVPPTSPNVDFLLGYLTVFMASSKDELLGLSTSAQATEANAAMATQYPDSQIVRTWNVSYEKVTSFEHEGADEPMQFLTMVSTVAAAGYEDTVNRWEMNKHMPDQMKSPLLSRVVRYKKIAGTGTNASVMPEYIEIFYYASQANFQGHNPNDDEYFKAAEADRAETWKNGGLDVPWIYQAGIDKEVLVSRK